MTYSKLLLSALLTVATFTAHAQLKTYSGPFKMQDINLNYEYVSSDEKSEGTATYSYKDAEDGTRTFHGDFKFTSPEFSVTGQFKDDYQVGTWVFTPGENADPEKLNGAVTLTFDEAGALYGPASYYVDETDHYEFSIGYNRIDGAINVVYGPSTYSYVINNSNHYVGKYCYKTDPDNNSEEREYLGYHTEGTFNNEGKPIGKWIQKGRSGGTDPTIIFSETGELQQCFDGYDDSTGDKIEYNFFTPCCYLREPALFRARKQFLMRSSKSPKENTARSQNNEKLFVTVEQQASFPGGQAALMNWISRNLRYPVSAAEKCIQGRVIVQFVIEADGSISNIKVYRSVDPELDKEAIRIVKMMPKWQPGRNNGVVVRSQFTLPITFKLTDK